MKRRTFLKYTCLGGINVCFFTSNRVFAELTKPLKPDTSVGAAKLLTQDKSIGNIALVAPPVEIIRPADLLNLRFEFVNLKLVGGSSLERTNAKEDAFIRVIFPPQHISERAFNENSSVADPPIDAWISGPSRLVFRIPKGMDSIPYTLKDLLSWGQLESSLVPAAYEDTYRVQDMHQISANIQSRVRVAGFAARKSPAKAEFVKNELKFSIAKNGLQARSVNGIIEPGPEHTAIEAPRRLILSPHQMSGWAHYTEPFTGPVKSESGSSGEHGYISSSTENPVSSVVSQANTAASAASSLFQGSQAERTELWHTRLGLKNNKMPFGVDEQTDLYRTVRAVYSPDYKTAVSSDGVGVSNRTESLTGAERNQIVHLSSNNAISERNSIEAKNLMLSPLGSWLDLQGNWILPQGTKYNLESWTHRAVMGRDTFVRVVVKGYLFPFGHQASKIVVTERRFEKGIAYLRFFTFIIVREPVKFYSKDGLGMDEKSIEGRQIPFGSVRIKTLVTPHLNPEPDKKEAGGWIMADNKNFLFKMEAEDWEGNVCEFMAPLNFVINTKAESSWTSSPSDMQVVSKMLYFKEKYDIKPECRESRISGQMIAYAPDADDPGSTSFETDRIFFGAGLRKDARNGELLFYPVMTKAKVRLSAACMIAGKDTSVTIESFTPFVQNGFGPGNNKGELFVQVPDHVPLGFTSDRSGGVATPSMNIRGISRRFGIIGGPAAKDAADDRWKKDLEAMASFDLSKSPGGSVTDPDTPDTSYFSRLLDGAKLLGGISLGDIIKLDFGGGKNVPRFQSLPEYDAGGELLAVKHIFEWNPAIREFDAFSPGSGASFRLTSEIRQPLDGSEPSTVMSGILTNFSITPLRGTGLDFVKIGFGSISFTSRNGEKPDFDIQGMKYEFINALTFFNAVATILEAYKDNFSDPPSLSISSDGIKVGYTLALPVIACGAFIMKNIAFSAGMTLPFNGPLSLDLAFASRENPFTMAVSLFGGGGFIGLGVGVSKLNYVEASLEAGALAEVNFGVAKGSVYAMVGVYFIMKNDGDGDTVGITAYFRCGGSVNVLHLITASIEIYFGLTYENSQLIGYGEIKVEVEVAFFSKTVTIGMHKTFATASLEEDTPVYAGLPFMNENHYMNNDSYCSAYGSAFADTTGGLA